ncbi:MAG TPA: OsmC family protein [Ignavibacteria bacterium]|nr:OsmC family protein [Ignavibacteria bacterium]HRF67402.1 OsmC family protein [Ignavibacteria bacterium]HRJ03099.1 OsmC family protein [Ignavibacteria bacterium]HRJ85657.1 OsmC family protein [Ignavibacteria bacterium]
MKMEVFFEDGKKVNVRYNGIVIKTDQPVEAGGDGSAPAPFDLFLASIGTCAGIYVKSFCTQRGIPTEDIRIVQSMEYDFEKELIGKIKLELELPDSFPVKYKDAVIKVANLCAVKKHLLNPPEIEVKAHIAEAV